jgi:hypothetical protein
MAKPKYPKEFLELCASVTGKRPKTVIDHILKHGHITTEELKNKYGYDHPPRAARDVRELGIPRRGREQAEDCSLKFCRPHEEAISAVQRTHRSFNGDQRSTYCQVWLQVFHLFGKNGRGQFAD